MQRKRSFEESGIDTGEAQSLWLKHFLSQKKVAAIPPPPIIALTCDTYLRQFAEQFTNLEHIVQEIDNDDLNSLQSSITNPDLRRDDNASFENEIAVEAVDNVRIRLSNLPYIMDKAAIIKAGMKYGIQITAVTIELDQKTNLPYGSAIVEIDQSTDEATAMQKLQGEDFGGRPVRVQSQQQRKRRASGGRADTRYFAFSDAAEVKCRMCGNLGHTARYCSELKSVLPCHLCAGRDHEAGKTTRYHTFLIVVNTDFSHMTTSAGGCLNITCFRCGDIGHHSKTCYKPRVYSKAVICTRCSSSHHSLKDCEENNQTASGRYKTCDSRNNFVLSYWPIE